MASFLNKLAKGKKNIAFFLLRKVKSDLILTKFREKVRILTISEKSDLATHTVYVYGTVNCF